MTVTTGSGRCKANEEGDTNPSGEEGDSLETPGIRGEAVARLRKLIQNPNPAPYALPIQFKAIVADLEMTGATEPEAIAPTDADPTPGGVRIVEVPAYGSHQADE